MAGALGVARNGTHLATLVDTVATSIEKRLVWESWAYRSAYIVGPINSLHY